MDSTLSRQLRGFCGIWSDHGSAFADQAEEMETRIKQLEEQNAKQADKLNRVAERLEQIRQNSDIYGVCTAVEFAKKALETET